MTALFALIRKDLLLYVADRRALLLNLIMPILLGSFFGFLFGGSGAPKNVTISVALVALDTSEIGVKLAAGLKSDPTLKILELPLEEAQAQVRKGKLNAAIVIPAGFGDAAGQALFRANAKPEIQIFYDPSQTVVLPMVKGLLSQQVMQTVSGEMFGGKSGERLLDSSLKDNSNQELSQMLGSVKKYQETQQARASPADQSAARQSGLSMPFTTRDEALSSGPKYNGYAHSFAGMSVQFILFMGIDAGISILLARRLGLWNRLLAAPLTIATILAARALSSALIAFILLCLIFLAAHLIFGVQIAGSLLGFVGVGICFALLTATFGLLIAAFGRTPEAARGLATFAALIMVMLSGAWVPAFVFPQWLQTATLIIPTRWAVDGLDAMTWRGLDLAAAWPAMLIQLAFSVLFGGLAFWKFKGSSR